MPGRMEGGGPPAYRGGGRGCPPARARRGPLTRAGRLRWHCGNEGAAGVGRACGGRMPPQASPRAGCEGGRPTAGGAGRAGQDARAGGRRRVYRRCGRDAGGSGGGPAGFASSRPPARPGRKAPARPPAAGGGSSFRLRRACGAGQPAGFASSRLPPALASPPQATARGGRPSAVPALAQAAGAGRPRPAVTGGVRDPRAGCERGRSAGGVVHASWPLSGRKAAVDG